jgi:myo-inositol-1(or 4)-monophosphatase
MMDSSSWLKLLVSTAEDVFSAVSETQLKGEGMERGPFKRLLDKAAQDTIVESFQRSGLSMNLISEEGDLIIGAGGPTIITDPIDGTTNLSRSLRPYVTCFATSENNTLEGLIAAVIMDLDNGETYTAERGKGAFLDGEPIKVATYREVRRAFISLDISKNPKLDRIGELLKTCLSFRMLGSCAKELCLVANGVFDAHVDIRGSVRATDIAASLLILQEAGGYYAINGKIKGNMNLTREMTGEVIAAGSQKLLEDLITITRSEGQ